MASIKTQTLSSLLYFFIAAFLGIVLRFYPIANVNATYKYMVHTHSHIALLGWVYVALTALIFHLFIKKDVIKKYSLLFWSTQITILGMLLSFPITGYALFSIIFSTLFLICSYWFYAFFKKHTICNTTNYSYKFIRASLLFMVFSSIGPWLLGIIMNTLGNTSPWYKNAIYYYLHFQYNGWFIFCLLGFFFYFLEKNTILIADKKLSIFFKLMLASCILTLFLSFLWMKPNFMVYILSFIGGFLQLLAFYKLYSMIKDVKTEIKKKASKLMIYLLKFVFLLLIFKVVLQFLTSIPYFVLLTSQIIDFVIGYLHLVFLGIVSISLLVFLSYFKLIKLSKLWVFLYLTGFVLSEILIFYKGFSTWQQLFIFDNYYLYLVIFSSLISVAVLGILIQNTVLLSLKKKN